ncbi:hypothetical protein UFOVP1351_4 [uncultured Caudovirales phage]|uniref:Uncharacterized protein n=1 Tax=uncultured Caudovirales phage TaxID=2100421 RepID=A0A6J5S0M9_9CAUD|nr:hypothetical protein UFOVP1351_4 [uncultured Caudovirales phage]
MKCHHCESECEQIPYPKGERYLCGSCGTEHLSVEAAKYREAQRKAMREIAELLNQSAVYSHRYIKGEPQ